MNWKFWNKKMKPSCSTCKFRKEHQVYGNDDSVITLGTCEANTKTVVAFSPSPNGFYYPNGSIITYPPDFSCSKYEEKDEKDKAPNTTV